MQNIKHVGRLVNNKRKVVVAYRVVPGEPENCIVVTTENLGADEHDTLMKLVESNAGQNEHEFANLMGRSYLPDGRNMLAHFHRTGKMIKVASNTVEMIPNRNTSIMLSELNQMIAKQKGVTVEELAIGYTKQANTTQDGAEVEELPLSTPGVVEDILTDQKLAEKYRKDAQALLAEAARLNSEAEKLNPTPVKTVAKTAQVTKVAPAVKTAAQPAAAKKAAPKRTASTAK
jgi:hypothetical protein